MAQDEIIYEKNNKTCYIQRKKKTFPPKIIIKLDNIIKNNPFRTLQIDQIANREMPMNELVASKQEWWMEV